MRGLKLITPPEMKIPRPYITIITGMITWCSCRRLTKMRRIMKLISHPPQRYPIMFPMNVLCVLFLFWRHMNRPDIIRPRPMSTGHTI